MKPEQQRIAIAEACGWKYLLEGVCESWISPEGSEWQVMHGWQTYKDGTDILPDYLNDLNAMHEAIMSLTLEEQCNMTEILRKDVIKFTAPTITATAAQRAEAFLKTLNLWTNDA